MGSNSLKRNYSFIIALSIILATIIIVALVFMRIYRIPFYLIDILGIRNSLVHWLGWLGALFIGLMVPVYSIIKRYVPTKTRIMLKIHVFGNLLSMLAISIHFAHQVTRPANNYPDLGTGIVLYMAMIILVLTGFIQFFGLAKSKIKTLRFLHPAIALTFYLTIIMHVIHGI